MNEENDLNLQIPADDFFFYEQPEIASSALETPEVDESFCVSTTTTSLSEVEAPMGSNFKKLKFSSRTELYLIPTLQEYVDANIIADLWYSKQEYAEIKRLFQKDLNAAIRKLLLGRQKMLDDAKAAAAAAAEAEAVSASTDRIPVNSDEFVSNETAIFTSSPLHQQDCQLEQHSQHDMTSSAAGEAPKTTAMNSSEDPMVQLNSEFATVELNF